VKRQLLGGLAGLLLLAGIGAAGTWGVRQFLAAIATDTGKTIPTAKARKSKVIIEVNARGELQGGSSEALTTPQTGGADVPITYLRPTGDKVEAGDVVVEFDTTQQEYNLREAEADLAEAQQRVIQAEAEAQAGLEEARYVVVSSGLDVKSAEWEIRKNPLLAATVARQNEISLEIAKNKLAQAQRDLKNREDSVNSSVAIQKAMENKSRLLAENAKRTIDNMVLKAKTAGYVHVQPNQNGQLLYTGAVVPDFQIGDAVRAGQGIALIPNMSSWEVSTSIPEVDRGYLQPGQKVSVRPAALSGRELKGHVKSLGGTSGYAWNRRFDCRIALDQNDPDLRPGMTANLVITVESLEDVLWVPSQALFESDGRAFVYVNKAQNFVQQDVKLIRRSESQAVITGIQEGEEVALSRPDQGDQRKGSDKQGSAMKALTK
jgi:HlyD family secretion protein